MWIFIVYKKIKKTMDTGLDAVKAGSRNVAHRAG